MEDNEVINAHITVIKRIVKINTYSLTKSSQKIYKSTKSWVSLKERFISFEIHVIEKKLNYIQFCTWKSLGLEDHEMHVFGK